MPRPGLALAGDAKLLVPIGVAVVAAKVFCVLLVVSIYWNFAVAPWQLPVLLCLGCLFRVLGVLGDCLSKKVCRGDTGL